MLGSIIGNYQVTGKLSEGGMGVVYRAEHALLGHPVAIKLILPIWSENHDIVQRFFAEAKVTSSIRHPSIVEIFDFGHLADGRAYIVMELLRGEPLATRLARERVLSSHAVAWLGRGIAGALAAAHGHGVVHRDLKPDNVFVVPDPDLPTRERVKILDFGIAKLGEARATGALTQTGVILGTPAYMSPEQSRGAGRVDARADLYSLGCILYEALAGRPPFVGEGQGELIAAHLLLTPDPVRAHVPAVDPRLEALVMRLLEKDPDRRPPGAFDVVAELAAICEEPAHEPAPRVFIPVTRTPVGAQITTLGGAAAAAEATIEPLPPRRRRLSIAAGFVAALAVGTAVLVTNPFGGDARVPAPAAQPAPAPPPPAPPSPPPSLPRPPSSDTAIAVVATPQPLPAKPRLKPKPPYRIPTVRPARPPKPGPMVDELAPPPDLLVDDLQPPAPR